MSDDYGLALGVLIVLGLLALLATGEPPAPCPAAIIIESPAASSPVGDDPL